MEAEQTVVASIMNVAQPRCALDVGTGTGRCVTLLSAAGAHFVAGIDLSVAMLQRHHAAGRNVCGDACRLPFGDGTFDFVCASLMAGDLTDLRPWVAEASRVLLPGGHLVYSDFHPSWAERNWRRTFTTAAGRQVEIPYCPHSIEHHLERLEHAQFEVRAIREPRIAAAPAPVVAVFHAVKGPARTGIAVATPAVLADVTVTRITQPRGTV